MDSVKLDSTLLDSPIQCLAGNGDAVIVEGSSVGSSLTSATPGHPDNWNVDEFRATYIL